MTRIKWSLQCGWAQVWESKTGNNWKSYMANVRYEQERMKTVEGSNASTAITNLKQTKIANLDGSLSRENQEKKQMKITRGTYDNIKIAIGSRVVKIIFRFEWNCIWTRIINKKKLSSQRRQIHERRSKTGNK